VKSFGLELRALARRLEEPCAPGCGEMGRCPSCRARDAVARDLRRLAERASVSMRGVRLHEAGRRRARGGA